MGRETRCLTFYGTFYGSFFQKFRNRAEVARKYSTRILTVRRILAKKYRAKKIVFSPHIFYECQILSFKSSYFAVSLLF